MWRVVQGVGAMLLWAGCSIETVGLGAEGDTGASLDAATDGRVVMDARVPGDGGVRDGGRLDAPEAADAAPPPTRTSGGGRVPIAIRRGAAAGASPS